MRVFECFFGFIGWLVGTLKHSDDDDDRRTDTSSGAIEGDDSMDCQWIRYYPQEKLWGWTFKPEWDRLWDYKDWHCNYYDDPDRYAADVIAAEEEIDGMGEFEPSNVVF